MQNAWVLNQEILIDPELYHPWRKQTRGADNTKLWLVGENG